MQIERDSVVTIRYTIADIEGNVLDRSEPSLTYLHGGYDGIFPLVEEALHGKAVGDACSLRLEPEDAFGDYDANLVRTEPRDLFPGNVAVGMQFEGAAEGDDEHTLIYTVTDVADNTVVVDGNHPLAGKALQFDCTVLEVRAGTREEIQHGHVHSGDGHHHH